MILKYKSAQKPDTAREIAIEQLLKLDAAHAHFNTDDTLPVQAEREHRMVKEYVQGIMRWKRWLDFVIDHYYRGKLSSMEPVLKWILRLGVYDLLLVSTPSHAAIHEAVELAKKRVRPGAGKLANGILRSIDRNRDALPEPDAIPLARYMSIMYSHPEWMVNRWLDRYGADNTEELLKWNNKRPVYSVRINTARITCDAFRQRLDHDQIEWTDGHFLEDFVRLPRLQPLVRGGYLKEGLCAVQDESAGLVVRLLDPLPGAYVVDACAAPGGKTLYAATQNASARDLTCAGCAGRTAQPAQKDAACV